MMDLKTDGRCRMYEVGDEANGQSSEMSIVRTSARAARVRKYHRKSSIEKKRSESSEREELD